MAKKESFSLKTPTKVDLLSIIERINKLSGKVYRYKYDEKGRVSLEELGSNGDWFRAFRGSHFTPIQFIAYLNGLYDMIDELKNKQ